MNTTCSYFRDLPDELILEILNHIDKVDLATIRALNATDRRLHHVTTGRLYRSFPGRGPQQFLRTIALYPPQGSPEISNHVKEVIWYHDHETREARQRYLPLRDRWLLADKLRDSGCILDVTGTSEELARRFVHLERQHTIDWWYLEFFLFFTPKVESVVVHDAWQWDDHLYWFQNVAANPTHFQHLKSLTLHGPLRLQNLVPLFTLPSIRSMELSQVTDLRQEPGRTFSWTERLEKSDIKSRLADGSCLEQLILQESDLDFNGNTTMLILESLNNLKSFTYEYLPNELRDHGSPDAWSSLWDALMRLNPLEHLRIRDKDLSSVKDLLRYFGRRSGSAMARAPKYLRTLDVGPFFLGNNPPTQAEVSQLSELLPSTLEVLEVQWNQFDKWQGRLLDFLEFLYSLAHAATVSGSNLKRIAIVDWPALEGWFPDPDMATNLERALEEMDVQFAVVYEDIQGLEPVQAVEDAESGWILVDRTKSFEKHCLGEIEW